MWCGMRWLQGPRTDLEFVFLVDLLKLESNGCLDALSDSPDSVCAKPVLENVTAFPNHIALGTITTLRNHKIWRQKIGGALIPAAYQVLCPLSHVQFVEVPGCKWNWFPDLRKAVWTSVSQLSHKINWFLHSTRVPECTCRCFSCLGGEWKLLGMIT